MGVWRTLRFCLLSWYLSLYLLLRSLSGFVGMVKSSSWIREDTVNSLTQNGGSWEEVNPALDSAQYPVYVLLFLCSHRGSSTLPFIFLRFWQLGVPLQTFMCILTWSHPLRASSARQAPRTQHKYVLFRYFYPLPFCFVFLFMFLT